MNLLLAIGGDQGDGPSSINYSINYNIDVVAHSQHMPERRLSVHCVEFVYALVLRRHKKRALCSKGKL